MKTTGTNTCGTKNTKSGAAEHVGASCAMRLTSSGSSS